jgi:hypothetical protein
MDRPRDRFGNPIDEQPQQEFPEPEVHDISEPTTDTRPKPVFRWKQSGILAYIDGYLENVAKPLTYEELLSVFVPSETLPFRLPTATEDLWCTREEFWKLFRDLEHRGYIVVVFPEEHEEPLAPRIELSDGFYQQKNYYWVIRYPVDYVFSLREFRAPSTIIFATDRTFARDEADWQLRLYPDSD